MFYDFDDGPFMHTGPVSVVYFLHASNCTNWRYSTPLTEVSTGGGLQILKGHFDFGCDMHLATTFDTLCRFSGPHQKRDWTAFSFYNSALAGAPTTYYSRGNDLLRYLFLLFSCTDGLLSKHNEIADNIIGRMCDAKGGAYR